MCTYLPKPITEEIFQEPILSKNANNNIMLPIGTKVRVIKLISFKHLRLIFLVV